MSRLRSKLEIKEGPEGLEIRLPRRFANSSGAIVVLTGSMCVFGGLFAFAGFNTLMQGSDDPDAAGGLAMIIGCGLLLGAYLLSCSRGKLVVGRDEIVIYENIGPLVRRRPLRLHELEGLRVYVSAQSDSRVKTARLQLWWRDQSEAYVLGMYSARILGQVAERLAEELEFVGEGDAPTERDYFSPKAAAERQPLAVALDANDAPATCADPNGKRAHVAYNDRGLVMTVPASGMTRHQKAVLPFGAIFFMAGVFFGVLLYLKGEEEAVPLAFMLLPGAFVVVGFFLMVWPLSMARRSWVFEIVGDELTVRRKGGFFGEKKQVWTKDKIQDIEVVDSTVSVNNRSLRELSIKVGYLGRDMLTGRDEVELQWVAAKLRDGMGMVPAANDA